MSPPKILLVDDEPHILSGYRMAFEAAGYDVTAVSSGEEAQRAALAAPFDFALIDAMMPQMDGFELTAWFRSRPEATGLGIGLLTALPADPVEKAVYSSDEWPLAEPLRLIVIKPMLKDISDVVAAVDRQLHHARSELCGG